MARLGVHPLSFPLARRYLFVQLSAMVGIVSQCGVHLSERQLRMVQSQFLEDEKENEDDPEALPRERTRAGPLWPSFFCLARSHPVGNVGPILLTLSIPAV